MRKPTEKQLNVAFNTLANWYAYHMNKHEKPITHFTAEFPNFFGDGSHAQIMTHFVFHGKDEVPKERNVKK